MGARIDPRLLLFWTLGACTGLETQPVDFQVDVLDAQDPEAAQVRLCVPALVAQSQGAREVSPLYLLRGPGEASGAPLRIELLDADGALFAQARVPSLSSYVTTGLNSCENGDCEPCEAPEANVQVGEERWSIAVRFVP